VIEHVFEVYTMPVSFNSTRLRNWAVVQRAHKRLKEQLMLSMLAEGVPKDQRYVEVDAELIFKVKRRRDEGNFRTPLEKALGDALVDLRILPDDTPTYWRLRTVRFEVAAPGFKGVPYMVLTLKTSA